MNPWPLTSAAPPHGIDPPAASGTAPAGYYGVPAIHGPHWKWLIIVYFYLGGITGAAAAIAGLSRLVGPAEDRRLVGAARYLSFASLVPCPVLLVLDLGRPARFHHMLLRFNPRSPMSLGTWGLTLFGALCGLGAAQQTAADDLVGRGRAARAIACSPERVVAAASVPVGLFVAGYTGVLLAATAVPLWTKRPLLLGPLFLASAVSTAASAVALTLHLAPGTPPATMHRLERLERAALLAEVGVLAAWVVRLGPTAHPLTHGTTGRVFRHGVVGAGLALPCLLHAAKQTAPARLRAPLTVATALLTLAGGFGLRYAVVIAGRASADDPRATFELTRARPPVAERRS